MSEKKLNAGEYVYQEGDTADAVYVVISGKVEILELNDGIDMQAAVIGAGNAFGELAIFDAQAMRPHSARALEACVLTTLTPDEFNANFAKCPEAIQPILRLVFDRMKAVKTRAKTHHTAAVLETDISKITVAPASDKLKSVMKPVEVPLIRLPFRIGGYPEGGETSRRDQLHMAIASQDNPLRVSRQHCEITIENKGLVIVDLGSRFCTWVNGAMIGRGRGTYMAPLKKGTNEITLGAVDGPYKLIVTTA